MSNLKEGIDYSFNFPESVADTITIKLLSGPFTGVVYKYGVVSAQDKNGNVLDEGVEVPEEDPVYLAFDFDIVEHNDIENLHENADFKNHIGDILMEMITTGLDSMEKDTNAA